MFSFLAKGVREIEGVVENKNVYCLKYFWAHKYFRSEMAFTKIVQ